VFVQVIDPSAFGGRDAFTRETGWLADTCRNVAPRPGVGRVRVPGEHALARRRDAEAHGVTLYPGVIDALKPAADKFGVPMPSPIANHKSQIANPNG
jgi:L-lactate dehydrogenase